MNHVFISYVRENRADVERLCSDLNANSVQTWTDVDRIQPGQRWRTAIRLAIRNGNAFLACFSEEYARRSRSYMNHELLLAIDELRSLPTERAWFFPVLLSPCQIPELDIGGGAVLSDIQAIRLYENWKAGLSSLVAAISVSPNKSGYSGSSGSGQTFLSNREAWRETWTVLYDLKLAGDELWNKVTDATLRTYSTSLRRAGATVCKNAHCFEPSDFSMLDRLIDGFMNYRCGKEGLLALMDEEVKMSNQRWNEEVEEQVRVNGGARDRYSQLISELQRRYSEELKSR